MRRVVRWIWFFIAIFVGTGLGAYYGWVVNPVDTVNASPESLRMDYKTDYVLMVAEAHSLEGDLALAVQRLRVLGDEPPAEIVRQALESAEPHYAEADLELMRSLAADLQTWNAALETPAP